MPALVSATKVIKVRPQTRKKYEEVSRIKRWNYVEVADVAVDTLIASDPDLESLRKTGRKVDSN